MNILFLTSGHLPLDDRIFYHMAATLARNGRVVQITSSKADLVCEKEGISLNCFHGDDMSKRAKIREFTDRTLIFRPDVVICSEPLTLLAAKRYRKAYNNDLKIIYDITEWYPSKKNLGGYAISLRWFYFFVLLFFNIRASAYASSFIFGEWYKSRPYRIFFPKKPFTYISYFPHPDYITPLKPYLSDYKLKLTYSGRISIEKGFGNFFQVLHDLTTMNPDLKIEARVIGWYESEKDKNECDHILKTDNKALTVKRYDRQELHEFINLIKDTDIFLDLRADDLENQHCLPIKLFYYAHLGRPVIFSDLKSVRREVEIEKFGFLVPPKDTIAVSGKILEYINNKKLYHEHCINARELAENKYNWTLIEQKFVDFISC